MQRDLTRLTSRVHDLVVIGGGIHGACVAWDAALRNLDVALIERDDFGAATSANSLRIVHGGLRSLVRGNLRRMRESVRERAALLRVAPSLVEPLPVLVPTDGQRGPGRLALGAALRLNDLLSPDRNRTVPPDRHIRRGRLVPFEQCRHLCPAFPASASGGALWWDARMRHPERLTFAFVRAAVERGAVAANYCRVDRVVVEAGAVVGVRTTDLLGGGMLDVPARRVVIAAGPWTPALSGQSEAAIPQAFALNVEIGRRLAEAAVGVRSPAGPEADPIVGGSRYLFLVPQEASTLLGTWYAPWNGGDPAALIRRGAAALLEEFRAACPALELSEADVVRCQWGLLPLKAGRERGRPDALADRARVLDHGAGPGPRGMLSLEGVKFTTARGIAENVVNRVVASLGRDPVSCRSSEIRIDRPEDTADRPLEEQVERAIREEMAVRLSDVILRRTSLGGRLPLSPETVAGVARIAGNCLGWTREREAAEIADVTRRLRPFGSAVGPAG